MLKTFLLCFIPIMVAMDPVGMVPLYLGLTERIPHEKHRKVIFEAGLTALLVAVAFMLIGNQIFLFLGVGMHDFLIAGGVLLFCFALMDLLGINRKRAGREDHTVGVVPLGTPLIAGPGVLAASMLLMQEHGFWPTALALLCNLALLVTAFAGAPTLVRVLREGGLRALSRIAALILAAFAVMMIRRGLTQAVTDAIEILPQ